MKRPFKIYRQKNSGLENSEQQPFFNKREVAHSSGSGNAFFQAKLAMGTPGDPFEREADHVANQVVDQGQNVQVKRQNLSGLQRLKEEIPVQKQEEEEAMQAQEEEEEVQAQEEEEEEVQAQEEEEMQAQEEEEEEMQPRAEGHQAIQTESLQHQLKQQKGNGQRLAPNDQKSLESKFGANFSKVRVHTNQESIMMNKQLRAQAFTNGNDIFFNSGKYRPDTADGKRLLAHELTHVVQQKGEQK